MIIKALIAAMACITVLVAAPSDTTRKLWTPYAMTISAGPTYGNYFNGFDQDLFLAHTRGGMPFRTDWDSYQSYNSPRYLRMGIISFDFRHGRKPIDFSAGMQVLYKRDSMFYSSTFTTNDTIYGRVGYESSWNIGAHAGLFRYFTPGPSWLIVRIGIRAGISYGGIAGRMTYYETRYDMRTDSGFVSLERNPKPAGRWDATITGNLEIRAEPGMHGLFGLGVMSGGGLHWVPGALYRGISRNGFWLTAGYRF